ncbi:hypothetical protein OIE68_02055 [Nocardia vinacea]|uniref:poly(ethylene terephthalate) hydrolase family protein n=1 Tax=Nocardia vinacea TaxID=96468 RepID=UPI002E1539D0|nr:hypothetical protein OIE68_02055 [Nocardia vinacea]
MVWSAAWLTPGDPLAIAAALGSSALLLLVCNCLQNNPRRPGSDQTAVTSATVNDRSQRSARQRSRVHAVAAAVALSCAAISIATPAAAAPDFQPARAVEATYYQAGPHPVAARTSTDCCTSTGDAYDIWYPADLGASATRYPIITWGDGTDAHPVQYAYLLSHLASWGFVVIAPNLTSTGTGTQMLDAVTYLTEQNRDPASVFYGKVNTESVGAMGHSQGGLGALNALARSGGAIETAVPIEMPFQALCNTLPVVPDGSCVDTSTLASGSVLIVSGTADPIAPSYQIAPQQQIGQQSMQGYYDALPASLPKAKAALKDANHNDIQGQPGCTNYGCTAGVGGYLGYLTAWFMDRLRGDSHAHSAFVAGTGELLHNAHWADQASNITN